MKVGYIRVILVNGYIHTIQNYSRLSLKISMSNGLPTEASTKNSISLKEPNIFESGSTSIGHA